MLPEVRREAVGPTDGRQRGWGDAMKPIESVRLAWRAITNHKLRSGLTTLGVIIGVAAVIAVTTLGGGFAADVTDAIQKDNATIVTVTTQPADSAGFAVISAPIYTESDVEALRSIEHVDRVSPSGSVPAAQLRFGEETRPTFSVTADNPAEFERGDFFVVVEGRTFDGPDEAVMSTNLASDFERNVTAGDEVTVTFEGGETRTFTVTGLVEERTGAPNAGNTLYVSYDHYGTTVETPSGDSERAYTDVAVWATDVTHVASVRDDVDAYFQADADAAALKSDDVEITVQTIDDIVDQVSGMISELTVLVTALAGIALVVGAIGIANIMIVGVTERTREIGIMKAVGGRKRDVMQLFLIESTILGLAGAVGGVVLGLGIGYLGNEYLGWPMVYPLEWIAVAVGVGVVVGIGSGLYPAWRAARVDPIEALRRE